MAQVVEHLPRKSGALISNPSTVKKKRFDSEYSIAISNMYSQMHKLIRNKLV
jgi:hypothetical protein